MEKICTAEDEREKEREPKSQREGGRGGRSLYPLVPTSVNVIRLGWDDDITLVLNGSLSVWPHDAEAHLCNPLCIKDL